MKGLFYQPKFDFQSREVGGSGLTRQFVPEGDIMNEDVQFSSEDWQQCLDICRWVDDGGPCGPEPCWPDTMSCSEASENLTEQPALALTS